MLRLRAPAFGMRIGMRALASGAEKPILRLSMVSCRSDDDAVEGFTRVVDEIAEGIKSYANYPVVPGVVVPGLILSHQFWPQPHTYVRPQMFDSQGECDKYVAFHRQGALDKMRPFLAGATSVGETGSDTKPQGRADKINVSAPVSHMMKREDAAHGVHISRVWVLNFLEGKQEEAAKLVEGLFEEANSVDDLGLVFNCVGWADNQTAIGLEVIKSESHAATYSKHIAEKMETIRHLFAKPPVSESAALKFTYERGVGSDGKSTYARPICKASCYCGACEVETVGEPKWVANCHCSQCRRALSVTYATLAGFGPPDVKVTKGEDNLSSYTTGKEERFSCKTCGSKVYAHLHHLNHKAIYNDNFTTPNHGPNGKIGPVFTPGLHIYYTSGNTNVVDGIPKFADLPAAFGGSGEQVDEVYHK